MPEEKKEEAIKPTNIVEPAKKKGLSTGAKIGIGIGSCCCAVILVIFVLILGGFWKIGNTVQKQQNYAKEFTETGNNINGAFQNFDDTIDQTTKKYPNFDSSDYAAVDKNRKIIQENYDKLVKMDVPEDYREIQNLYEQGISYYLDGMDMYKTALQSKKSEDFQRASDLFKKGQEKLNQAQEKVKEKE